MCPNKVCRHTTCIDINPHTYSRDESSTGPPVVGGTSPKRMSRPSSSSTIGEQQRQGR